MYIITQTPSGYELRFNGELLGVYPRFGDARKAELEHGRRSDK